MSDNSKKDNQLEEKMALARQAMGGNLRQTKKTKKKWLENQDRQRAIKAMENKNQQEKRVLTEEALIKRRLDAQRAMASPSQRTTIEQTEKRTKEIKEIKEKLEQQKLKTIEKQKEEENQKKIEQEKIIIDKTNRQNKYLKHLQKTNELISSITKTEKIDLERYRTLKTDSNQTVVKNNLSLADIAIKERQKETSEKKHLRRETKRNKVIVTFVIVSMLILSVGIIYFAINLSNQYKKTELVVNQSIIFAEEHTKIDVTDLHFEQVYNILVKNIDQKKPLNSISHIYFSQQQLNPDTDSLEEILLPVSDLLKTLDLNTPLDFNHFLTDQYMFGFYHDSNNSPFLILETTSFANTLNTLLKNEALIVGEILGIFDPNVKNRVAQAQFSDKIISNIDTRIAVDLTSGEVIGLYAFVNQNIVIFTQNEKILDQIIERLKTTSTTF